MYLKFPNEIKGQQAPTNLITIIPDIAREQVIFKGKNQPHASLSLSLMLMHQPILLPFPIACLSSSRRRIMLLIKVRDENVSHQTVDLINDGTKTQLTAMASQLRRMRG